MTINVEKKYELYCIVMCKEKEKIMQNFKRKPYCLLNWFGYEFILVMRSRLTKEVRQ